MRKKLNDIIRKEGENFQERWRELYATFLDRTGIEVQKEKGSKLSFVESRGQLGVLLEIAIELFGDVDENPFELGGN